MNMNTVKNIEDYCRRNREKSISPSLSIDISQNAQLSKEEKLEKFFYSATVADMAKELFGSFDDIMKHVNFYLTKNLKTSLKKIPENYLDQIIYNYFDNHFKSFTDSFDKGEMTTIRLLDISDMKSDLCEYLTKKTKRKSLIPMFISDEKEREGQNNMCGENSSNPNNANNVENLNVFSPLKTFENDKKRLAKNVRELLSLKVELAMEKRIRKSIEENNFDRIKEKFQFIDEQIKNKPDLSYIDRNLDIMSNKLKMMRREIRQLNN